MIDQAKVKAIYAEERKRVWDAMRGTMNPRDIDIEAWAATIARAVSEAVGDHVADKHTRGAEG